MTTRFVASVLLCVLVSPLSVKVLAADHCEQWVARAVSAQGQVEVKRVGDAGWAAVRQGDDFCAGDTVRVEARSRAKIAFRDHANLLSLEQKTAVTFSAIEPDKPYWLEVLEGAVYFISRVPRVLNVETKFLNAAVEGTEFMVRVEAAQTDLWVYEGRVLASNTFGSLAVTGGQAAVARAGEAPVRRVEVRPRDATQWALYYPPLIDLRADSSRTGAGSLRSALEDYRQGDLSAAFAQLDAVPEIQRDARFHVVRAGLLLSVGSVDEARADIRRTLELDPANGTAYALESVVAVVQNDKERALDRAREAAELAPKSPVPRIALSYAHQAHFDIGAALQSAQHAVDLAPEDALAWARLAELQLSLGDLDRALDAAQRANALDPDLARTQTVLGFAYLTRIDTGAARAAFEQAIALDQADPLPRLGLGLARIRDGELEPGRQQIEIAASLDPNHSLIRSYLGKAYFEERRDELAGTEFAIARELDGKDPTPWFYDAIRKQLNNRPVEALRDLQTAIELNDNRAVYRSQLLLDQDLAARSASLGRIYSDLGFEQLALIEGWKSLSADPANHSAHRLLADSYAALPRHDVARSSELLQAQLLQPLSIVPVQPQLSGRSLFVVEGTGPSDANFNEFTPLFTRDRTAVHLAGIGGGQGTLGDSVALSGIVGRSSYSVGQYHFETDGFRPNNGLKQDAYNFFVQTSPSPQHSFQGEIRSAKTEHGDINLRFDSDFSVNKQVELDSRALRLGYRFSPNVRNNFLVSAVAEEREESSRDNVVRGMLPGPGGMLFPLRNLMSHTSDGDARTIEIQHIFDRGNLGLTTGAGYFRFEATGEQTDLTFLDLGGPPPPILSTPTPPISGVKHRNIYAYSTIEATDQLTLLIGASYDSLEHSLLPRDEKISPKFGLTWAPSSDTTVRAAFFETLRGSLYRDATIEPTNVAGFFQAFDDFTGTDAERYGVAVDHRVSNELFVGVELSRRELEVPIAGLGREGQSENLHRAYLHWTPSHSVAVAAEYHLERRDRDFRPGTDRTRPARVATHRLPLTVSYFHPSGLFGTLTATHYRQYLAFPVTHASGARDTDGESDAFSLVDASIGFRLPKDNARFSLGVRNLFDRNFRFQDPDLIQNVNPGELPRFISLQPERSVFLQFTMAF